MRTFTRQTLIRLLLCATLLILPATASAQEDPSGVSLQVEHFEPLPNQSHDIWNIVTSDMLGHLDWQAQVINHLSSGLFVLEPNGGGDEVRLVDMVFKSEFAAAIGLFDVASLGVVVPVAWYQSGDDLAALNRAGDEVSGVGMGDIRFVIKSVLIPPEKLAGFGLNFAVPISFPTGSETTYNSESEVRFEPRVGIDWRHDIGIKIAANIGYYVRQQRTLLNLVAGSELRWGFGVHSTLGVEGLTAQGSIFGALSSEKNLDPDNPSERVDERNHPVEFLLGVNYDFPFGMNVGAGGGAGITNDVGAPDYRVLLTFGYSDITVDTDEDGIGDDEDQCVDKPEDKDGFDDQDGCPDEDNDKDGIADEDDKCPDEPEDTDGFEDSDGCPDTDNDGDGVEDSKDQCKDQKEDADGFEDEDGCPEDNDEDGIADADDKCPNKAEDTDGFEDEDGCPDDDNDEDGIADADDQCPDSKEDTDNFQDTDGCPDDDNDEDGIADVNDQCPDEAEVINGNEDTDGCPDDGESYVAIDGDTITVTQPIQFASGRADVAPDSSTVLDQVAALLTNHSEITIVSIAVYPEAGTEAARGLAERRAVQVKQYLASKGVKAKRLGAKGLENPVAEGGGKAPVEFKITARAKDAEASP